MDLIKLASTPQLVKVAIDDEDTIAEFGEALEFYVHDRQDMDKFVKLATLDYNNFASVGDVVKDMILDAEGNHILRDGNSLPTPILMKAITQVIEILGKSVSPSMKNQTKNSK
jgi:hypothetical protein